MHLGERRARAGHLWGRVGRRGEHLYAGRASRARAGHLLHHAAQQCEQLGVVTRMRALPLLGVRHELDELHLARAKIWQAAEDHCMQRHAERPHVRWDGRIAAHPPHLRRSIRRSPRRAHARIALIRMHARHPKVRNDCAPIVRDQDVVGLQVVVHHPLEVESESAVVSTCMQGRSSVAINGNQRTLEVEVVQPDGRIHKPAARVRGREWLTGHLLGLHDGPARAKVHDHVPEEWRHSDDVIRWRSVAYSQTGPCT